MENEHHFKARIHFYIREPLLRLGKNLVRKGILNNPVDIFELTIDEIMDVLSRQLQNVRESE